MSWTYGSLAWIVGGFTLAYWAAAIFLCYRRKRRDDPHEKPFDGSKALQGWGILISAITAVVAFDYADRQSHTSLQELDVQKLIKDEISKQTIIQEKSLNFSVGNIGYKAVYGDDWTIHLTKTSGNIEFPDILYLVPVFNLSPIGAPVPGRSVPIRRDDHITPEGEIEILNSKLRVCVAQNTDEIDCSKFANLVEIQIQIETPKGPLYVQVKVP